MIEVMRAISGSDLWQILPNIWTPPLIFPKYLRIPSLPYIVRIQDSELTGTFDLIPKRGGLKNEMNWKMEKA